MIALAAALGRFHLAQQSVHLRYRQLAIGANRAMAGQAGQQTVEPFFHLTAVALGIDIRQHIAYQSFAVTLGQQGRQGANEQGVRPQPVELDAQRAEFIGVFRRQVRFGITHCQPDRQQQGLTRHRTRFPLLLELLVGHPLMRGVGIDQHQSLAVFRQDERAVQVRQGVAKRRRTRFAGRRRQQSGLAFRVERGVAMHHLLDLQGQRRLPIGWRRARREASTDGS